MPDVEQQMTSGPVLENPVASDQARHLAETYKRFQIFNRVLIALMAASFLAVLVAIWTFYSAEQSLKHQLEQRVANAPVTLTAIQDVWATQSTLVELGHNDCDNMRALHQWLNGLSSVQRNDIPRSSDMLNAMPAGCADSNYDYGALDKFLNNYLPAVGEREEGKFKQSADDYQAALADGGIDGTWRAAAYEGLAYAKLKLGDVKAANDALNGAVSQKVDNVYVELTALKLACSVPEDKQVVREMYATALKSRRVWLKSYVGQPNNVQIANQDLDDLKTDPEMRDLCGYAGLESIAPE